jgi:hypothetical protein
MDNETKDYICEEFYIQHKMRCNYKKIEAEYLYIRECIKAHAHLNNKVFYDLEKGIMIDVKKKRISKDIIPVKDIPSYLIEKYTETSIQPSISATALPVYDEYEDKELDTTDNILKDFPIVYEAYEDAKDEFDESYYQDVEKNIISMLKNEEDNCYFYERRRMMFELSMKEYSKFRRDLFRKSEHFRDNSRSVVQAHMCISRRIV